MSSVGRGVRERRDIAYGRASGAVNVPGLMQRGPEMETRSEGRKTREPRMSHEEGVVKASNVAQRSEKNRA